MTDATVGDALAALIARHTKPKGLPKGEHKYRLVPFDDLQPDTRPSYLVDGIIPASGLVAIWGPPKCGKSFWAFDLTMHVALWWDYRGRRVHGGPVVYLAFEGASGFGARAEAFRRTHEGRPSDIQFYLIASNAKLVRDHQALIESINGQTDLPPVAVVLDTLNRSIEGSESKDQDMGAYLSAAEAIVEAFDCVVIIVHHCGVDGSRPRGHTSLTGAVDAQLAVKRDSAGNVVVLVEWMKDGKDGSEITSRLKTIEVGTNSDGKTITSCAVVPADDATATKTASSRPPRRMPPAAKTALKALREAVDQCGERAPASNHIPASVQVTTVEMWRTYAYKFGISDGGERAKQKAFKIGFDHLNSSGEIAVWGDFVWLAR
jgi:hypothetical protein